MRVRTLPTLALLCGLLAPAGAAQAATPARIVRLLNRERILNSLPAEVSEDAAWTAACEAHDTYERLNGGLTHEERAGRRGYSAAGAEIAATSVLAQGIYWDSGSPRRDDPYDGAPFQLFDLLNPRISSVGAADSQGFGCVEIELGTLRPAPAAPLAYSYPGEGRRGVPVAESAAAGAGTPARAVGLGSRQSGPNLLVYFEGPWTDGSRLGLAGATLSSPAGAVPLRWLDNTTSNLLAPTGAILVPVHPLRPHTRYTVRVHGSVTGIVPGTSIEEALASCGESALGVDCGETAPTACFENFAAQAAVCGLTRSWAVRDDFTFTTAGPRG